MYSKEEYFEYYKSHNKCVDDFSIRKHPYTQTQLETKYSKYVKKQNKKKEINIDTDWQELISSLPKKCELIEALKRDGRYSDIEIIKNRSGHLFNIIDGAHYKSRQKAPFMKYNRDNVVSLNRYSHSNLDFMRHPIYGTPITKEECEKWWRFILGDERYERLNKLFNKRKEK